MSGRAVILVAGGTGTRMQTKVAKQFLPLGDKPVLFHTFEAFHRFDPDIFFVLVLFKGLEAEWKTLIETHDFHIPHTVVTGGAERFHSVKNGLDALPENIDLVAVHDAVRPFASQATIAECFKMAAETGAAIPVVPVTDTIRQNALGMSKTLPRHELVSVHTPQCFRLKLLRDAYNVGYEPIFTDDASVMEHAGHPISLVTGNRTNIKITTREDLIIAEALLREEI